MASPTFESTDVQDISRRHLAYSGNVRLELIAKVDLLVEQEVHGTEEDVRRLRDTLRHTHRLWFFNGASPSAGGLLVMGYLHFLQQFPQREQLTLDEARCGMVRWDCPLGAPDTIDVHINPNLRSWEQQALINKNPWASRKSR